MKRTLHTILMASIIATLSLTVACGKKGSGGGNFPEGFNSLTDTQKVEYMMNNAPADSVARFIIYASLGKIPDATIDSISIATLYAYENYTDTALQAFSLEFDKLSEELPIYDKMRLRALVGAEDPQRLGLTLGLEYMNQIRIKEMSAADVKKELVQFKKACADNPDLYARFLIGFRTVLRHDVHSDMPKEIYDTFLNYDEAAVEEYKARNKALRHSGDNQESDSLSEEAETTEFSELSENSETSENSENSEDSDNY